MLKRAEITTINIGKKVEYNSTSVFQSALKYYNAGEFQKSAETIRTNLQRDPKDPEANNLLGLCYLGLNRPDAAEILFRRATEISSEAHSYMNLGLALGRLGRQEAAKQAYRKAIELDSQNWGAYKNLANIYYQDRNFAEAAGLYREAWRINPDSRLEATLLAECFLQMQKDDEAFEVYRTIGAWGFLQFEMRKSVRWKELASIDAAHVRDMRDGTSSILPPPFRVIQMKGATAKLQKQAAHTFAIQELPELDATPVCPPRRIETESRPLRVGYLSSDLYDHATLRLLAGVFEAHDRSKLDVSVFCYSPIRDGVSKRLRTTGISFVDILQMSDQQAAREIYAREIDILVDLKGYTASARLGITALRPAPVIVNWLGYPGTMGHPRMADYIIGDPIVTPPKRAGHYSERLALMPNAYQPNDRLRPLPEAPSRSEVGLPEKCVVFCSFNQTVKFNPSTFDIWGKLLSSVPGSVLWLPEQQSEYIQANLLSEFLTRGIQGERIVFAPRLPQAKHLARIRAADIALDTFPYNSHTTASDAIWAGIPLVTLMGDTFAGRVAASLLTIHGFPELVAESQKDYFELARNLATNARQRDALKRRLDQTRMTSPLFDTAGFTRDLEDLYRAIADNHNRPVKDQLRVVSLG